MRFVDEIEILVEAGKGGNGCKSFLRLKRKPRAGPDGGDGGKGGDILIRADGRRNTLLDLRFQRQDRAQDGKHGRGKQQHGRKGEDLILHVPPGTLLLDAETGERLIDLHRPGDSILVAQGGKGGHGNMRFVTSTCRAPDIAEQGLPGQTRRLRCELKLLADVGIVGMPNAGKSTLLSRISSARPKIADYPFTTLVPYLGIARLDEDRTLVVADIPGIIPGASKGEGLGLRFLRHIERAEVLLFLLDLGDPQEDNPLRTYRILTEELAHYSPRLLEKKRILALNKIDLPLAKSRMQPLSGMTAHDGLPFLFISTQTGEGIPKLVRHLTETFKSRRGATTEAVPGDAENAQAIGKHTSRKTPAHPMAFPDGPQDVEEGALPEDGDKCPDARRTVRKKKLKGKS